MTKKAKKPTSETSGAENDNLDELTSSVSAYEPGNKSVGELLTEARKSRRKEVDRIAKELRISADKLRAMEEDNFAALPGRVYAIGFLRTYANYLGLDGEVMIEKFKAESSAAYKRQAMILPASPPPRRMPGKQLMLAAFTLLILVYTVWYFTTSPEPQIVEQPEAPATQSAVIETLKNTSGEAVVENVTDAIKTQPGLESESAETIKEDVVSVVGAMSAETPVADDVPSTETEAILMPDAVVDDTTAETIAASTQVTLVAKSENWVQIIEPNGVALLSKVMAAGETFEFKLESGITLTTGNAGALEIKANGKTHALGKQGQVLQNYAIDLKKLNAQ